MSTTLTAIKENTAPILASYDSLNGGLDVNIQSSTSPLFQFFMQQVLKDDIILTSPVAMDDEIINVSAGHGFIVGELLTLWGTETFEQLEVTNVLVDAITVEMPVANSYIVIDSIITRGVKNLILDGSITSIPIVYEPLKGTIPVDVSGANITFYSSSVGDDGKFGGGAALTKGIYFRQIDGVRVNLGNFKDNGSFRHRGGVVTYPDKGPSGTNSVNVVFDFENTFGQVIRVNPNLAESICMVIRDNITVGNTSFVISLVGSYTQGEV